MQVTIIKGHYRGIEVENQTFELVQEHKQKSNNKGYFVTVKPNKNIGDNRDKIRVTVKSPDQIIYPEEMGQQIAPTLVVEKQPKMSDEQKMAEIGRRFEILSQMTKAAIESKIRGMIVTGPPGVGKSYGVIEELEKANLFNEIAGRHPKYEIIKGSLTAIGLYARLYKHRESESVLLFDDCDVIFNDETSLNLLKAALDSGKKRRICWNADSNMLRSEGIPDSFLFNGSVIFITNKNFDNVKSKKIQEHLAALQSRCHFLDLAMHTMRDRILRIKQIYQTGELFKDYYFENNEGDEIIAYMEENKDRLREMSLRMAIKIADLYEVDSKGWKDLARDTVLTRY